MAELIRLSSVDKTLGHNAIPVLKQIDLTISDNDYAAIVGPSGSGKSTLLSIIGLLDSVSSGKYLLKDHDVSTLSSDQLRILRNQQIGWVFQNFNLIGSMSCIENVALPLRYNTEIKRPRYQQLALEALEKVGLLDKATHFPNELSGGQQQRVAIARALVNQPSLLVADEPTGNLDSETSQHIQSLFSQLHQGGTTILLVTHDANVASSCAKKIELRDGEIINVR